MRTAIIISKWQKLNCLNNTLVLRVKWKFNAVFLTLQKAGNIDTMTGNNKNT